MAKIELHFTCDHEIFGNGSGGIKPCMVHPAEHMMTICEEFGAKLTFFFDVCEYWAMKEVQEKGGFENEHRPADLLEEHLGDIVKRGHQVQLHFHPQWLNYEYKGRGDWDLDLRMWRLPEVEHYWQEGGDRPLVELFRRGKETLEKLLRPVEPGYQCIGFRAGAWSIQPEKRVLAALRENGFNWDSTVAPGKKTNEDLTWYDFTKAPQQEPAWKVSDDVCQVDEQGDLWEYPIFTAPLKGWTNGRFTLLKLFKKVPLKAKDCEGKAISGPKREGLFGKLGKLREAFRPGHRMFNFTDGATFEEMKFMAEAARKQYQDRERTVPIVAIGHSKTFGNERELRRFMEWCEASSFVEFGKQLDHS